MCFRVQAEVKPDGQTAAGLSEAALSELLDQCEDQFAVLEKVNPRFNFTRLDFTRSVDGNKRYEMQTVCLCVAASE